MPSFRKQFKTYIKPESTISLPEIAGLEATKHYFDENMVAAILVARAINRPLLVKGEPGLGKSQIARAIAAAMDWNFISHVVHAKTQPSDLLFRMDHVKRLAKAQVLGAQFSAVSGESGKDESSEQYKKYMAQLDDARFVVPGPLWWAYHPASAAAFFNDESNDYSSALTAEIKPTKPCVLLLDEIDKADRNLPNTLLEVLNNRRFDVPTEQERVVCPHDKPPFVVITSNSDRPLPHAFIRRCVVLNLTLSDDSEGREQLIRIANTHYDACPKITETVRRSGADLVIEQRKDCKEGDYKPGVSEYLDLLKVLQGDNYNSETERQQGLEHISKFILRK